MQDRPTSAELIRAVREHLEREVIPGLENAKLRYQTLVAAHVLSVVERDIAYGERAAREELRSLWELEAGGPKGAVETLAEVESEVRERTLALCRAIRTGNAASRPDVRAHVRAVTIAKLAIANPAYKSVVKVG
jgi:Domain of unknown function (DUF6285)